jgi:hypothetical protein
VANSATLEAPTGLETTAERRSGTPGALLLRLRTRLRRPWLDGEIARGEERPADRALSLREAQLVAPRERRRLARRLEQILDAQPAKPGPSSVVPVDREAVDVAKPLLAELIRSLRSTDPIEARGVVLGWRLLTDATSPIYGSPGGGQGDRDGLWYEALAVLFALRPLAAPTATPSTAR